MFDFTDHQIVARQTQLNEIFVDHARHQEATKAIRHFYHPVEGGLHGSGAVAALIGPSRAGKTYGVRHVVEEHPASASESGVVRPVLLVDCPIEGGVRAILESIADALGLVLSPRITNANFMSALVRELQLARVEYLVFDEAQELFPEKNKRVLSFARALLRKLLNLKQFNILCIGLPETYSVIAEDSQLIGRGGLPYQFIKPYDWNCLDDQKKFRVLCQKFDEEMPFELSGFATLDFSSRLYHASRGGIGLLKTYFVAAGERALNAGAQRVRLQHFADAFDERKRPGETFNPFRHDLSKAS